MREGCSAGGMMRIKGVGGMVWIRLGFIEGEQCRVKCDTQSVC